MFSSIEPYDPLGRVPAPCTANTYSYPPVFLPVNEKTACTCSQTPSQSAPHSLLLFTLEIAVKLHLQFSLAAGPSVYFPPTLHVPLIFVPLPLSYRALFRRPLVYICSTYDVIPGTSIVNTKRFPFVITF